MTREPTVLALDTAGPAVSVAVRHGGRTVAYRKQMMDRGHAVALMPMIDAALADSIGGPAACANRFDALDRIGVSVGPGGFTGLRVGLAAARGLSLATGIPACGITGFDAIANGLDPAIRAGRPLVVVIDSKRTELFVQLFGEDLQPLGGPRLVVPADLLDLCHTKPMVVAGDAAELVRPVLARSDIDVVEMGSDARSVAQLAARAVLGPETDLPVPLYLRPPDATPRAAPSQ